MLASKILVYMSGAGADAVQVKSKHSGPEEWSGMNERMYAGQQLQPVILPACGLGTCLDEGLRSMANAAGYQSVHDDGTGMNHRHVYQGLSYWLKHPQSVTTLQSSYCQEA